MQKVILGTVFLIVSYAAAAAQEEPISACQEQQQLEQVLGSDGEIMPDGCREVQISVLESEGERLCLVDLSGASEGIIGQLEEIAVNQRWWMRCQDLEEAVR